MKSIIGLAWKKFISLKLTFFILVVIGLGAFLGMSFDQTITFDEFYQSHQSNKYFKALLAFFELNDAFHSWWFSLAVLFLALNLIACSIERLPRIYFEFLRPRPYLTKRRFLGLSLKKEVLVDSIEQANRLIAQFFPTKISKARLKVDGFYYWERQKFGRFGVYVVHIALLVIMFSAIFATQNGVDGQMLIEEGGRGRFITARGFCGIAFTYDLGFYVGCDDFRLHTFIDNSPMEFESDLYILDQGKIKQKKTVRVNEPLSYAGFTFYQASFRKQISEKIVQLEIDSIDGDKKQLKVKLNEPIPLKNGTVFVVEKIYEDFAGLGQALRIKKIDPKKIDTYFHIFRKYQDYDRVVRNDDYSVAFIDTDQQYETGLSVGKVPGISIIFSGFLLLMIGLYMCFFMTPVRFFARTYTKKNQIFVRLAAQGFRNKSFVENIFEKRTKFNDFS